MSESSKQHQSQSPPALAPFMEQARKQLEADPSLSVVAHIPKDPAGDTDGESLLRPSRSPWARSLIGRSALEHKSMALTLSGCLLLIGAGISARAAEAWGLVSQFQLLVTLLVMGLVMVAVLVVTVIAAGISLYLNRGRDTVPTWVLPRRGSLLPTAPSKTCTLLTGEEELLARHSAAALWNLHDGRGSKAWKSEGMTQWRSRLDLREEAAQTVRAAGALQELRESLGGQALPQDEELQAGWRDDYAVYCAGLAALRERVQYQLALQLAVETVGRQVTAPQQDRKVLASRIAAGLPSHEQAIETLSGIAGESAELGGFLTLQLPVGTVAGDDQAGNTSAVARERSTAGSKPETT